VRTRALALAALVAAGCSTSVEPTNPFDPATPQTAPSSGAIFVQGGASATSQQVVDVTISAVGAFEMRLFVNGVPVGDWIPYATSAQVDLGTSSDPLRVISVLFRTAAHLEGGSASVSVFLDQTPPVAPALTLLGTLGNGQPSTTYSSGVAITAQLGLPADPTVSAMALVQQSGPCTLPSNPPWQPAAAAALVVLSGADGPQQICAWLRDEAGNIGSPASASITLDTIAPTNPSFTALVSGSTNQPAVSAAITPSTDATSAVTYQCLGGQYGTGWTDCAGAPPFSFTLAPNASNTLGVRARDAAWNTSAGSLVTIVHDDVPPVAPGSMALVGTLGNGQTSTAVTATVSVTATLVLPADPSLASVAFAQGPCTLPATPLWQPATPSAQIVLSGADGPSQVCAWLRDAAGNVGPPASASITLDTAPPTNPTITNLSSGTTNQPTVSATVTASTEATTAVIYQCLGGQYGSGWTDCAGSPPFSFTLAQNQSNTLGVRARDGAWNASAGSLVTIVHDGIPPAAATAFALTGTLANGQASTSITAGVSVTASLALPPDPSLASMAFAQGAPCTLPASPTWLPAAPAAQVVLAGADGAKTVCVWLRDAAGNVGPPASAAITLDTAAPTNPAFTNLSSWTTNQASVSGSVTGISDATTTAVYQCFGGQYGSAWTDCAGAPPFSFTLSQNATNTLGVRARDSAYNYSAGSLVTIVHDNVPPAAPAAVALVGTLGNGQTSGALTASLSITANVTLPSDPSLAGMTLAQGSPCTLPGSPVWQVPAPSAQVVLGGADGAKTVCVWLKDAAGNVGPPASAALTLDTAPPTNPAFTNLASGTTNQPTVSGSVSATSDATTTAVYQCYGGQYGAAWGDCAGAPPFSFTLAQNASNTLGVRARDSAYNVSAGSLVTIVHDNVPPAAATGVSLVGTLGNGQPSTSVTAGVAVTAQLTLPSDPTLASMVLVQQTGACALPGIPLWQPAAPSAQVVLSGGDGGKQVCVWLRDLAGNVSPAASAAITLDTAPPTNPAFTNLASGSTNQPTLSGNVTASTDATTTAVYQCFGGQYGQVWTDCAGSAPFSFTLAQNASNTLGIRARDTAYNVSAGSLVTIVHDNVAPAAASGFTLVGTLGTGQTSTSIAANAPVVANLTLPSDPSLASMAFAQGAPCTLPGSPSWQPAAPSAQVVLSGADGAKTVCVWLKDVAGNVGPSASATITLDTTPPTNPAFTNLASGSTNQPTVSGNVTASTDATTTAVYQCIGGQYGAVWTDCAGSPPFSFTLAQNQSNTLGVRARDSAYNFSAGSLVTIVHDNVAPAAPTSVALLGTLGNGQTSGAVTADLSVTLQLTLPADPSLGGMTIAQGSPCTLPGSPVWQTPAPSAQVVLSGADGAKTVCAWLKDAAGNVGPAGSASITLDTSIPTNPSFTNLVSGITNQPTAVGNVTGISDATTTATYQCFGGQYGQAWADCAGSPPFSFTLVQNASNALGVRSRDQAYNYSAGSLVTIVHDNVPPVAPFITTVRTTRTSLVLAWNPSPDPDVASYRVYYGNAAGDFSGTGAAQGPSPVYAGPASVTTFTLTGLSIGRPYYVAVEAVDQAGNASGPSGQRYALPNKVNPRVLSSIGGYLRAPGVRAGGGHTFAYVAQNQGVVQLQVDSDAVAPITVGRATVPNLAPDAQAPLQVVDCTSASVAGHCVMPTGSTLEGDARSDRDDYRANPPVVFFPLTGTAAAPSLGLEIGALPARPHRLIAATISGQPGVYSIERGAVKAYNLVNPLYPRLLWTAPLPITAQTVLGAGIVGTRLLVYAAAASATPHLLDFDATGAALVGIDRGVLYAYDNATALGAYATAMPSPFILFQGGTAFYVAYSNTVNGNTYLSSYTTASPFPASSLSLFNDGGMGELEVVSATAGNNHAYVFAGQNGTPYVQQVNLVGGGTALTLGGTGTGPGSGGATGATVAVYGSGEHALAVNAGTGALGGSDMTVQRWTVSGATVTRDASFFREVQNTYFAESDRFVFASQATSINTIDASNPLQPVVLSTYTLPGRTYGKLVVHGRYLFAIDVTYPSAGIDVFRIGGNGVLTRANGNAPFGAPAGAMVNDVAVVGAWAFVAGTNGIWPYFFDTGTAYTEPGQVTVTGGVLALDARPYAVSGSAGFLLYASQFGPAPGGTQGAIQTYTYLYPGSITALSASYALPGSFGMAIKVRGNYAIVSDSSGSWAVGVGSPQFPFVSGQMLPVSGPVLLEGGYVVGLATSNDGPSFTVIGSGATDGTMLFSECSNQGGAGSLASRDGVYYAGCQSNGLQLLGVADPLGGALMKSYSIGESWQPGAALAGDGMYSWLGGATVSQVSTSLYNESEQSDAAGTFSTPSASISLSGTEAANWMLYSDGLDYVVASDGWTTAQLLAYETAPSSLSARTTASTLNLPAPSTGMQVSNQPVTDGERVYVPYDQYGSAGRIDAYDVRDATYRWSGPTTVSTAIGIESLAIARDRLYAGTNDGRVFVWDTTNFNFATQKSTISLPAAAKVTGLAVSGRFLFATDASGNLTVVKLGATDRDGNGASIVGTLATVYALANPTVVGDVLYASGNLGTATYDLTPLWTTGALPTPLGSTSTDPPNLNAIRLAVDGPFAYLVGGVYRAFDLR
jgi:hypothetical protein